MKKHIVVLLYGLIITSPLYGMKRRGTQCLALLQQPTRRVMSCQMYNKQSHTINPTTSNHLYSTQPLMPLLRYNNQKLENYISGSDEYDGNESDLITLFHTTFPTNKEITFLYKDGLSRQNLIEQLNSMDNQIHHPLLGVENLKKIGCYTLTSSSLLLSELFLFCVSGDLFMLGTIIGFPLIVTYMASKISSIENCIDNRENFIKKYKNMMSHLVHEKIKHYQEEKEIDNITSDS